MAKRITEKDDEHLAWYMDSCNQTLESLPGFLLHLSEDYEHDYGTIVHAITAAALAAATVMDHSPGGGITGFQASCVMWEFIAKWMGYDNQPLRLIKYEEMLYPQSEEHFDRTLSPDTAKWLQTEAQKRLAEDWEVSPNLAVIEHWQRLATGSLPFGYTVKDK